MSIFVVAFLMGVLVGLRSMTAPAATSWAARLGWLPLENTGLAFLGFAATPYVLTVFAIGELIADKLPNTPSRKAAVGFIGRIGSGALCGAALGATSQAFLGGLLAGVLGAVAGTFGGYEFRSRLVRATGGNDLPIALLEDAIAIGGAVPGHSIWVALHSRLLRVYGSGEASSGAVSCIRNRAAPMGAV